MKNLKRTSLYPEYEKLGARMIDFGGWELPVQFSGILHEHELTRTKVTLFDVSHMGQISVSGSDSILFLQQLLTNDVTKLTPGRVQYTLMCNDDGGTVDDFLLYMLEADSFLLVVNASNIDKDMTWLKKYQSLYRDVIISNKSEDIALLAIQGPKASAVIKKITDLSMEEFKAFSFYKEVKIKGLREHKVMISRTGYTGEDGFEIYINRKGSRLLWNILLKIGEPFGIEPAGLGARDTLRLEAGLPLYGQELNETITPVEANLQFAVKLDKSSDFIGKKVIENQINSRPPKKIVGIELMEKGIPRTGYVVLNERGEEIGTITSGTQSPTLKKSIGLALVNEPDSKPLGSEVFIQIRKRKVRAKIIKTPFYTRH